MAFFNFGIVNLLRSNLGKPVSKKNQNATRQLVYEDAYAYPLIDVSFRVNGFYLINILSEEKSFTEKIFIKHSD